MSGQTKVRRAGLHPGHHWGPFARDPWSPDLDPVVGTTWDLAAMAGRAGTAGMPRRGSGPASDGDRIPDERGRGSDMDRRHVT